ncbi:hypothetical protein HY990_03370 [Candidatus Micrarchaeota archaeon]|nr:hypothetical protein [Candidatus Micrarchaeota archaeon]
MNKGLIATLLLFLISLSSAQFILERADVIVNNIQEDGSARVHESIKFAVLGNYSYSLYDSAISKNDLAYWYNSTNLNDIKFHVNLAKVNIRDFRLRPQPRTRCNTLQGICHGELILDYEVTPLVLENESDRPIPGTGLFTTYTYKPRTRRYLLNPSSLSFVSSGDNLLLENKVFLTFELPQNAVITDVNPKPTDPSSLTWNDIVLVKYSLLFEVEDNLDKEVADFFSQNMRFIGSTITGPSGIWIIGLIVMVLVSSLYIATSKRKGGE